MSRCMTAGQGSAGPQETGTEARHEISELESPARPVNTAGNSGYNFGSLTFIHTTHTSVDIYFLYHLQIIDKILSIFH